MTRRLFTAAYLALLLALALGRPGDVLAAAE